MHPSNVTSWTCNQLNVFISNFQFLTRTVILVAYTQAGNMQPRDIDREDETLHWNLEVKEWTAVNAQQTPVRGLYRDGGGKHHQAAVCNNTAWKGWIGPKEKRKYGKILALLKPWQQPPSQVYLFLSVASYLFSSKWIWILISLFNSTNESFSTELWHGNLLIVKCCQSRNYLGSW